MSGKTGVLAVLVAAFFCSCVSAAANEVQGLVPTRDGDRSPSCSTTSNPDSPHVDLPIGQAQAQYLPHSSAAIDGTDGTAFAVTCDPARHHREVGIQNTAETRSLRAGSVGPA